MSTKSKVIRIPAAHFDFLVLVAEAYPNMELAVELVCTLIYSGADYSEFRAGLSERSIHYWCAKNNITTQNLLEHHWELT